MSRTADSGRRRNLPRRAKLIRRCGRCERCRTNLQKRISEERIMGFGRGILLWLLGVPIPVIILLALFWR
ncbi:MAG TPA: hypothetical protein VHA35_02930 [Dongiaceae bacterium]|nr:hypothetical protein [Dongiaceae bacterium]